ncbi:hypothetical protein CB0940_00911 [Cercospora beticola]|uniref:BZIP domain-containing protein n=1 Tax=Cercospora beticola TaxID=122368 RepID=A0A2G5I856_CERBT|nr:hypothetical protein CB0940_00911 [Cercospora beticola]PIB00653.1 hypothetical protein CB0940_00911 [Cercospora beticola]WPA96338.1 hypothetical protein RHO25_000945 [Cercospora beticola]
MILISNAPRPSPAPILNTGPSADQYACLYASENCGQAILRMAEHRADSEPPCARPDAVQQDHDALADDWSHTADRKAKKRMQNRVAQRSYRQRMKARVEELQAKVEQLEGTKHSVQNMDANAHVLSPDTFNTNALFTTTRDSQLGSSFHSGAPTANMVSNTPPSAPHDHPHAVLRPITMEGASQASHGLATFALLNSNAVPSTMAQDMSNDMSLHSLQMQSTPFGDQTPCFDYFRDIHGQHTRQPHSMDAVTFQDAQPMTSTAVSSASRPGSPPSGSSLTPDFLPSLSGINSPDDSYRSSSMASAEIPPHSSHLSSGASVEDRLRYVAEQAKVAGFPDLDSMITAYYTVLAGDPSAALGDSEGSAARRLPRLIATLRHAVQEWRDWERKGFPLD